ncbi:MAG: hypothetical protein JWM87_914 [Candidatus Eremiobacteraeota bacterium]|nr:hypothetical protein [Candidatus Eremiobacteraeota bacterium]
MRYGLRGRIVTMDAKASVLDDGVVWIADDAIAAVTAPGTVPDGFSGVTPVKTGGTIYPGLIELHNHLAYNILQLWDVDKQYGDRDQWHNSTYQQLVTGPLQVVGGRTASLGALVRYVEAKALAGGTTTSQGITLAKATQIQGYFRGTLRIAEMPGATGLPSAHSKIGDVTDVAGFATELAHTSCFLLHLAEGTDAAANAHFQALKKDDGTWAVGKALAGIHGVGLAAKDWKIYAERGGALVWSPLSNLLLYGQTARVADAKAHGVRIALGADWSFSGSKNVLGELKTASLFSAANGNLFTDLELVRMVTSAPAGLLGWSAKLGSIEPSKIADLTIVHGTGDPYRLLVGANESKIAATIVSGAFAYGDATLATALSVHGEKAHVAGADRIFAFRADEPDPVKGVTLASATALLKDTLAHLGEAVKQLGRMSALDFRSQTTLVLDEDDDRLRTPEPAAALKAQMPAPAADVLAALHPPLKPLQLDELTAFDDARFFKTLEGEKNLPEWRSKFRDAYGVK